MEVVHVVPARPQDRTSAGPHECMTHLRLGFSGLSLPDRLFNQVAERFLDNPIKRPATKEQLLK